MGALAFDQSPSALTSAQIAGLVPAQNLLINPDFRINQRVYVSAVTLAAGAYGHDRWKAGAAGGDYSFTQLASSTTITIAAGKSLIQVVEDKNVPGGSFVLSWSGTAQCRVGVNSATPSGAYASSPIQITGQTAGTTMSVEAGPGTFGFAKLETGLVPTPFVMSDFVSERDKCLRYFETSYGPAGFTGSSGYFGVAISTTRCLCVGLFRKEKRAAATFKMFHPSTSASNQVLAPGIATVALTTPLGADAAGFGAFFDASSGFTVGVPFEFAWTAEVEL